jgi:hypothetical protein
LDATPATAQSANAALLSPRPDPLITQSVDDSQRTILRGNIHPLVRRALDQGPAPSSLPMQRMMLVLKRSAEQESALRALLDDQQTQGSPSYRHWLTPQQFGQQFGPADSDIAAAEAWLESHGFEVASVSNGRTVIEFSGTAGQVQEAFHDAIHGYQLNGEQRWANAGEPSIPSALAPLVAGVVSLHNFPRRQLSTVLKTPPYAPAIQDQLSPLFTYNQGSTTEYGLGPADFATIYNVLPLWNAGIDGTGQTIAIVGETNIHLSDIANFRSIFGLPANAPNLILNGPDPGISGSDEPEAVLDVSWSGAVAPKATIDLVASQTTSTSLGVDLSALYIVDNDLAPVMSESYGDCEATLGNAGNAFYNALWQQAAAEGVTVVIAAGDAGSAGCDNFDSASAAGAGLAVSGTASTPYNISVGGTDFDQNSTSAPNYWSATNNSTTGASALGYIPETTWNQSCAAQGPGNCLTGGGGLNIVSGGGGPSSCVTQNSDAVCAGGYSKPAWQSGPGVPQDGVRDQPDVSLFSSAGFRNSFYIICEADYTPFGVQQGINEPCSLATNSFVGVGGTSASAPSFAAIMALVNQKTGARLGNANYILYNLAAKKSASCNSSTAAATGNSCIFYDITKGNNSVPCAAGSPNCGTAPSNGYGILVDPSNPSNPAWTTTAGYDLATGLGSVNVANLAAAWSTASFSPSSTTITSLTPVNLAHGQQVSVNITVAANSGSGTPTGSVALMAAPGGKPVGVANFTLANGTTSGTTTLLPGGTYNVTAHYSGDGAFASSDSAPMQVTVGKENSQTLLTLESYDPANGKFFATNTIPFGSIAYLRGNVTGAAGTTCGTNPLLTGVACPTGSLSFNLGGKPLDAGTYALNSQGFAEDESIDSDLTSVGSYAFQAQYGGDASYNPDSSATLNATVTQASTTIGVFEIQNLAEQFQSGGPAYLVDAGQSFTLLTEATALSLSPPTGTLAFSQNGTAMPGTIQYSPFSGAPYAYSYLEGQLTTSINTPGTYTLSASYPGSGNFLSSQSPYTLTLIVSDTTFNIASPIPSVTVAAGQTGSTIVTILGIDNFAGLVNLTCALPATMSKANCPAASATLGNSQSATAQLTITTTAPQTQSARRDAGKRPYGFTALACVLLFLLPLGRKRKVLLSLLLIVCFAGFSGCGGGSNTTTIPGTPAGTYTVTVTAASQGITRTGTFTVTVQ